MKIKKLGIIGLSICLLLGISGCSKTSNENAETIELNISAAASLKEAMGEIEKEYKKINENVSLVINYGGSGTLQQQIEQGAPCDIFISAGQKQMKALEEEGLLLEDTYKDLLKNDLVLIASKDSDIQSINDLLTDKVKHIAIGEKESVPAGKYADEVLTNLNLKSKVENKLVFAKDVKEVLAWTQSKNAEVGFVYYSDTINSDQVKIIETTSEDSHSDIIYPVGIIKSSKQINTAKEFQEYLLSNEGQEIFKEFGYKAVN